MSRKSLPANHPQHLKPVGLRMSNAHSEMLDIIRFRQGKRGVSRRVVLERLIQEEFERQNLTLPSSPSSIEQEDDLFIAELLKSKI